MSRSLVLDALLVVEGAASVVEWRAVQVAVDRGGAKAVVVAMRPRDVMVGTIFILTIICVLSCFQFPMN